MGQFHDAVSTLLEAFSHGISIISIQRIRRKKKKTTTDSTSRDAEICLETSLKKNRKDVKSVYRKDLKRFGPGFASGDEEARSSLSAILLRLNAGFVAVIERFTKGRSTSSDYQILLNLSNASRIEAMQTFERLSTRLSHSSLALVPVQSNKSTKERRRKTGSKKSSSSSSSLGQKRAQAKNSAELSVTPLGPATREGWVRRRGHRRKSSDSKSTKSSSSSPAAPKSSTRRPQAIFGTAPVTALSTISKNPPPIQRDTRAQTQRSWAEKRKSSMSFASDSTKIGEIPERKWAQNLFSDTGDFAVTKYYPIEPYKEPEKQRLGFMRLFSR